MLEIRGLTRTFPNGNHAFVNLDLSVAKGEILGILGSSGCGKSSLLRVIAGLDEAEGRTMLDGKAVRGISSRIGLVFQEPRLMPWLNVEQNAGFGLRQKEIGKREAIARRDHWLEKVGLGAARKLFPKQCSGGMAQRTALARTLATNPEILLLDEPFSALDAFIRMQLQDVLLNLWEESRPTLVLVTHDIDEALYICDRIVVLRGQPGQLAGEFAIAQSRPRMRGDAELGTIKDKILGLLDLSSRQPVPLQYNI